MSFNTELDKQLDLSMEDVLDKHWTCPLTQLTKQLGLSMEDVL